MAKQDAERVLRKTLADLYELQAQTTMKIRAIRGALSVLGAPPPATPASPKKVRQPMSKAERIAVSERMKRYWAKRRAE